MTLYLGIKYIRTPLALPLLSLFCLFFGLTFVINYQTEADSVRYAQEFINLNERNLSLGDIGEYLFQSEESKVDLYQPLLTWFLSNFTNNPKILFAVFGLIFGIFHIKNILIIVHHTPEKAGFIITLLLLTFVLINPIWSINGVRMWTAAQICIFGMLNTFLLGKRKNGLIWCFAAVFVHFSFLFPLILILIFRVIPKNITALFVLFIVSFSISQLDLELVRRYIDLLPALLQDRLTMYTKEAVVEKFLEEGESPVPLAWHVILANNLLRYFVAAILSFLYVRYLTYKDLMAENIKVFLALGLFFSAFANISALLPSGSRFLIIGDSIAMVAIILYVSQYPFDRFLNTSLKIISPALAFVIIFKIRVGFDFIGFSTVFGNPVLALFFQDNEPIIEFIKSLL